MGSKKANARGELISNLLRGTDQRLFGKETFLLGTMAWHGTQNWNWVGALVSSIV
jgi:hypothetical protein